MKKETAKKPFSGKAHQPFLVVERVAPAEGDLSPFESNQSVVEDRDSMRVTAQIAECMFGSSKGRFGINYPIGARAGVTFEPINICGRAGNAPITTNTKANEARLRSSEVVQSIHTIRATLRAARRAKPRDGHAPVDREIEGGPDMQVCRFGGSVNAQLEHSRLDAPLVHISPDAAEHPPSDGEQCGRRFTSRREQPGRTAWVAARSRGKASPILSLGLPRPSSPAMPNNRRQSPFGSGR